jgi:hypothetical protein
MRPFCFMIQFWGRRYRDYFVNYCLPSLLAPGNLPLLKAEDGHCFLIATPREDWDAIVSLPIFDSLRKFATPVLIDTPPPSDLGYGAVLRHQTYSLKRLFEAAYARNGYGCAVWPDTLISDRFVAAMQRWSAAGYHLVMQPTVRLSEEDVLADLELQGLLPERNYGAAFALAIPPRVIGELSVKHLHPELQSMEEGHPHQPLHPPYRFWRMPDGKGLILHVLFATPVLIDFAVVAPDHAQCLDSGDWETHYVGRNFSECGGLYVPADSDETGILSITPSSVDRTAPNVARRVMNGKLRSFFQLCNIRASLAAYTRADRNVVRRDMFRVSVRWHGADIDSSWKDEEQRIQDVIDRATGDYYIGGGRFPSRISLDPRYLPLDIANETLNLVRTLRRYAGTVGRAIAGKDEDVLRLKNKIRGAVSKLLGRG